MQVNSIQSSIQTVFQDKENRNKAKYIGAATLLSAGSAFLATKPAKNAVNQVKTSGRILKATGAGIIAAGVMTLLSLKKEDFAAIKDKAMGFINKDNNAQEPVQAAENVIPQPAQQMQVEIPQTELIPQTTNPEEQAQGAEQAQETEQAQNVEQAQETQTATVQPQVDLESTNVEAENAASQNPFAAITATTTQG